MWPLAGLALLAFASGGRRRSRGLGTRGLGDFVCDENGVCTGQPGPAPSTALAPRTEPLKIPAFASTVWLLEPAMYVHPARKAEVAAKGEAEGSRWLVVPASGWAGAKPFATAKQARTVLKADGFKGPYGHGQATRWTR